MEFPFKKSDGEESQTRLGEGSLLSIRLVSIVVIFAVWITRLSDRVEAIARDQAAIRHAVERKVGPILPLETERESQYEQR